ncbi:hypothetical protein OV207_25560 [Corallococcus sp. BB11-1]|uniref:imm11 family protein n=1 Tax=Corallococcus sp. BB11-1 TaxID=2996783 RepID=UPI002270F2F6|nr:DUF1629 domain-containing protein [Corallococcus sp. BB11-1]MCY1034840.1 hypothetical protein [Corallococcus sp. BB11-1]
MEIVDLPDKVEDYFYLRDGVPMASYLPPTTQLSLYEEAGDMFTDFIDNPDRVLYVSQRVGEILSSRGLVGAAVEMLPFVLLDKRGRRVQESYFIANPLVSIPCLDFERSKYRRRASNPNELAEVNLLHLREDVLPEDAQLFRVAEFTDLMVLRSDLLDAFHQAGLTGLAVHPSGTTIPG